MALPVMESWQKLARCIGMVPKHTNDRRVAAAFIQWIKDMNQYMKIPEPIQEIRKEDIPAMAKHVAAEGNPLYPVPVLMDAGELEIMYEKIIEKKEGKADAILGLETFSNMQHVLKTVPVTTDQLNIYGKNKIESIGALANKKVAVMARSVIMTIFDLQCEYVEYNTNSEILKAVEMVRWIMESAMRLLQRRLSEKENLSVVPSLTIMNSFLTFGVREDKEELRDQMNTILKYYANQGTLASLENKWIVNYSRNRSLSYVIEQNKVFYVAYLITWLFVMFLLSILKADYSRKQHYIATLLEYQSELEKSSQEVMRANQAKSDFCHI